MFNAEVSDVGEALFYGIRFDLFVFGIVAAIPFLLLFAGQQLADQRVPTRRRRRELILAARFIFLGGELLFFVFGSIDSGLFPFFGRRLTRESFSYFREAGGKLGGIFDTHWSYILACFSLIVVFAFCAKVLFFGRQDFVDKIRNEPDGTTYLAMGLREATRFLIGLAVILICIRGGFQKKPLNFVHGQIFEQNELNQLVLNTGFTLIQSWGRVTLKKEHYFDYEEMMGDLNQTGSNQISPQLPREKFRNVVVILVESLSYEFFDLDRGAKDVPFLKSLSERSLFFKDAFANARRSIEGVASVVSGVPSLMNEPFISSTFSNNHLVSLGQLFKERGFETYFFHGGYNGTMYFDQYSKHAGFDHYIGAHEYTNTYGKNDDDDTWGIYDGPFTQYMADILCDKREKPFLAVLFTLTSHHPFHIPAALENDFSHEGEPIEHAIRYTDDSLRKFFERVATCNSFRDTLFVVTADHAFNPLSHAYENGLGEFRIPILFYSPGVSDWPLEVTKVGPVSQIDLIPSISDLFRLKNHPQNYLARSVFRPGDRKVILFEDQHYWLVKKDTFLYEKTSSEMELFSRADPAQRQPLDDKAQRQRETHELKAGKQFFSEGLWYDRLYLENY